VASIKALHIEIGARVSGFVRKMRKIRRDLRRMRRDAKRMSASFIQMGKRAAIGVGLIGAGMVAATKRFATFEANLLRVQALTNGTEKDFNALKATAERMGITTAFTASEAAEAMVKLAQQGRTTTQTMFMLPKVLDLAVVGTLELDEAARLAGVTLNQFGLGVAETERAADVLAKGASVSATTVQELGEALTYAGPLAKNMGFSLEETVAVLAAFANVGVVSGRSGRAFAAVIAELGTEIREQGLIGALDKLAKSGKTADQLMTELNRIAGRSVGSLREVTGEILDINDELVKAAGTSKNFAEKVLSKTEGAFVRLRSAADGLINSLGETFAPFIVGAFEEITNSLKTTVEFMKDFRHEMGFTEEAGAALAKNMLAGVAGVLDASAVIMKNVNSITGAVDIFLSAFRIVGVILAAITFGISKVMQTLAEGLNALGVGDGSFALEMEIEAEAMKIMMDDLGSQIADSFDNVADGAGNATTDFIENLGNNFERIREKFEGFKPPEAPEDPSRTGTPDLGGGLVKDPEIKTLFNQFPDVQEELMKIPATLAQVSKEFDGFLAQDLVQNLVNAEISLENLDELVGKLEDVGSAVRGGFLDESVGNAIADNLLKEAGAFTAAEPPDFSELQGFIGDMSATLSERDFISELAGFKVGSEGDRAILDSDTLTNSVVDQFVTLFDQLEMARVQGRLAPGEFAEFSEALRQDLLTTARGDDLEDPTQGFTDSLQTALGAVKVDPFAETSQKRTMKASEETAKATQEIAKNTKGLGSILT
tara:strand:+ start:10207 stop:12519 length:2313 start_codon:yes stop_codon:yes gene_type:complete